MTAAATDSKPPDADALAANAMQARVLAPQLCSSALGVPRCDWYHGFYPTLRLLGLAATPARHAHFYADAIAGALGGVAEPCALVAGTADTAMLALLVAAAPASRVRVADRCATPLALAMRWAGRHAHAIETEHVDLAACGDAEHAAPCDLAVTHSLLAVVPPVARVAVLRAIRARLRPGGAFVSTARLDPDGAAHGARLTADGASAFADRVRDAARTEAAFAARSLDALRGDALRYAERMASWPFASADEIAALAAQSSFAVTRLDVVAIDGTIPSNAAGAGSARAARYAEFVLART